MLGYIISSKSVINVEEHEIKSFDILHKTNLNIFVIENNKVLYKNNIIYYACYYGQIEVLEWFKNSGYEFKYDKKVINNASKYGNIQILEWFKNSDYDLKYDESAITWASYYGHIQVLEWFKNSGYEFKYNKNVIKLASASFGGNVQILEWFKTRNVKKVIKMSYLIKFLNTIKFKTKNNYIKGYNKN
jgi:hypothetical protein